MNQKNIKLLHYISILGLFMMSVIFLFMPGDPFAYGVTLKKVLLAILFWSGMISVIVTQVKLTNIFKSSKEYNEKFRKRKIGIACFFSNRYASIADLVCVLSLILLIISFFLGEKMGYFYCVIYIIWFIFLFSFSMHCILNGKKYYYIRHILRSKELNKGV